MAEFTKSEMEAWQKKSGALLSVRRFALCHDDKAQKTTAADAVAKK